MKKNGWKVVRLWEYDIKHSFEKSFQKILNAIGFTMHENVTDALNRVYEVESSELELELVQIQMMSVQATEIF